MYANTGSPLPVDATKIMEAYDIGGEALWERGL